MAVAWLRRLKTPSCELLKFCHIPMGFLLSPAVKDMPSSISCSMLLQTECWPCQKNASELKCVCKGTQPISLGCGGTSLPSLSLSFFLQARRGSTGHCVYSFTALSSLSGFAAGAAVEPQSLDQCRHADLLLAGPGLRQPHRLCQLQ